MLKRLKKILKIVLIFIIVLFGALIILFYKFSTPKTDADIEKQFSKSESSVFIKNRSYKNFNYRVLEAQKEINTLLPTIVFIHGSIGSALDFKRFIVDEELNKKANLITYDRVGYGVKQTGNVQESIKFETELLEDLIGEIDFSNVILVGYSYGGPIALASKNNFKKKVLLAPAVYSKYEKMPWGLNLYKWKATRWLMPNIWKAASKEKLSHKKDLQNFEEDWNTGKSKVLSIHGDKDWIVPLENSIHLKENLSPEQFELVTLKGAGHGFVWSHFTDIRNILLQQLN